MRKIGFLAALVAFVILLFGAAWLPAQNVDNTQYVKQYLKPWLTIGQAVTAAQNACNPDTAVPCVIVFDPSLAKWTQGIMPAQCTQCQWLDYRTGAPYIPTGGGHVTGPLWTPQVGGVYTVDGITYTTCSQAVAAALASSWAGVTVDCSTSLQHGTAANALAGFDPGSKSVDLNLGGVVRNLSGTITVRTGLHVHGLRGDGAKACALQATFDGPMFKDPADGSAVYAPIIEGCTLLPVSGATTASIAIDYDQGSAATTDILDHFILKDLLINGFPGGDIRLASAAANTTAVVQFGLIDHVDAEPQVTGRTLPIVQIEGDVGNTTIIHSVINQNETDAPTAADLDVGDNGGSQNVYRLDVKESTIQLGGRLITLHGCHNCVFESLDWEGTSATNGVYMALGGSQNGPLTFDKIAVDNNVGSGAGGFLWNGINSGNALKINIENSEWGCPTNVAEGDTSSHTQAWRIDHNFPGCPYTTTGISNFLQGNTATLVLDGMHQAVIDDTTAVTNITSWLAPGESFELCAQAVSLTLSNAGNLYLGGASSFTIPPLQCRSFALNDFWGKIALIGTPTTGTGAAVPTGPASSTVGDIVSYVDALGGQQDSGIAAINISRLCNFATFSSSTTATATCSWVTSSDHCTFNWQGSSLTGGLWAVQPGNGSVTVTAQNANSNGGPVFCSAN